MSGAVGGSQVKAIEVSGLTGIVEKQAAGTGSGANPGAGNLVTASAGDFLIACMRGSTPTAPGAGWTLPDLQSNSIEYQIAGAPGTYPATWVAPAHAHSALSAALRSGAPLNPWVQPAYAGNSAFNATQQCGFIVGNVLEYERTQPWTVMAAIKTSIKPASAALIFTNVPANGRDYKGYELWLNSTGHLQVRIISVISTNYIGVIGSTVLTNGAWHFVAATYDGSSTAAGVKLYVDGVLETPTIEANTLTTTIVGPGQDMLIGNQNGRADTFQFRGYIDEFSIHNVVRSAAYISAISPTILPAIDANVQLCLHFDEGVGNIANDSSANGFHATFPPFPPIS
jgi:hypothetical protein